jgi:hypothetical protein
MKEPRAESRMVLGLPMDDLPREAIESAFEIAKWLNSGIDAVMFPSAGLDSFAAIPFAREFQPLLKTWKNIDFERFASDRRALLERCRREMERMAASFGLPAPVRLARGEGQAEFEESATATDVIAIPAPLRRMERHFSGFPALVEAALEAKSSTLIVPQPPARRTGPVMAVIGAGDDPALAVARKIAEAARSELVVARAAAPAPAAANGARTRRERNLPPLADVRHALVGGLNDVRERVVVMSGKVASKFGADWPLEIVLSRRVPLLIVK